MAMNRRKATITLCGLAALGALAPLFFGAYSYYEDDMLTSINTARWWQSGTVTATCGGLTATTANGGALISKLSAPGGPNEHEVRSTLTLTASGGTYVQYLRASSDAMSGPAAQGTYYSVELQNPTFSGAACTGTLAVYQRVSGVVTLLASAMVPCKNGMTMRSVVLSYGAIMAYTDNRMQIVSGGLKESHFGQFF